mgnify:CR=1 FL=1
MAILEKVEGEIKEALKNKQKQRLEALRSIKTALWKAKTEKGANQQLSEEKEVQVLQKQLKQRKESAEVYEQQNRSDLAEAERNEAEVINEFLPEPISDEELTRVIALQQEKINQMLEEIQTELGEEAEQKIIDKKLKEKIKEKLKDIPKLHYWSKFSELGSHDNREAPGEDEQEVVLVIRGELLKKYPNAVIYAHRAKWKPKSSSDSTPDKEQERELVPLPPDSGDNPPKDTVKTPLYEAKVDPDIYFFGFDLNIEEVQGLTEGEPANLEDRAGWFFVIKERPGEPRFGLDIGTTEAGELEVWNDMSWGNVTPPVNATSNDSRFLQITAETQTIDVSENALEPDDDEKIAQRQEDKQFTWNENMNSAELAYILFQAPVMVAVHGAEMLPKT